MFQWIFSKHAVFRAFFILLFPLLAGCNGDLFIDDFLEKDIKLSVACGDSATIHFDANNWQIFSIEDGRFQSFTGRVYDHDGNLLAENGSFNRPGLVTLAYDSDFLSFEVARNSFRTLTIRPIEMLHNEPLSLRVQVGNEKETKLIPVTVTPGPKYQVDSIVYNWDSFKTWDYEVIEKESITIHNHGSKEVVQNIYPYKNGVSRDFSFYWQNEPSISLIFGKNLSVAVPDVANQHPVMKGTLIPLKQNFEHVYLEEPSLSPNLKDSVVVPPHSAYNITTYLKVESYEVDYTFYASNSGSARQRIYRGKLSSVRPFGYLVIKQKENPSTK